MEQPYDIKKEIIMSKLDSAISQLQTLKQEHDLVGITDIIKTILQAEKEVKEY